MDTALLYARVSSKGKQGDNFSIPTQLQLMREEMTKRGYTLVELADMDSAFIDGLERPKLQEALEMAKSGKIKVMMFFSSDRFTRDIGDGVILRRELKRHGVKLFFYYPTITEITSEMELFHIINDWRSQQQVEIQRDKSMIAVENKARLGLYPEGLIAYGYYLEGRRHNTTVCIDEEEARTIKRIFIEYLYENIGCSDIARRLTKEHVPTPGGKTIWTERMVRKVLNHAQMYAGVWYAQEQKRTGKKIIRQIPDERIKIDVPPIITSNMRDAALDRLATRRAGREPKYQYLLSGRSVCACGQRNTGQALRNSARKLYKYYRCLSTHTPQGTCGRNQFPSDKTDETVWQFALELIRDPDKLIKGWQELQKDQREEQGELQTRIASLDEQIAQLTTTLEEVIQSATDAKSKSLGKVLTERAETMGAMLDELEARKDALTNQLDQSPIRDEDVALFTSEVKALGAMYEALHTIDEEADFEAKRALIDILNLKATLRIDEEGQYWVDIHWLTKIYPEKLCVQKTLNPRHKCFLTHNTLTFPRLLC